MLATNWICSENFCHDAWVGAYSIRALRYPPLVWMQNYKQPHEPHVCSDNVSWCDEVWRLPGLLLLHAVHCSILTV